MRGSGPTPRLTLPSHPMSRILNCRKLQCPMPIVELSMAVKKMASGEVIVVEATDPAFEMDVRAWSEMTGNEIEFFEPGDVQRVRIRVA